MEIEVRLFAGLRDLLPDAPRGRARLDLPDGTSVQDLLERLAIHPKQAQMVLVNGLQTDRSPAARRAQRLAEGDTVAVFPPLAGG